MTFGKITEETITMTRFIILPPDDAATADAAAYEELFHEARSEGINIDIAPKRTPVPISDCCVEIIVFAAKSAAAGVIGHYAVHLWRALEKSLKERYTHWTINLSDGKNYIDLVVDRDKKDEGLEAIEAALIELEKLSDQIERNLKDDHK